MRQAAANVLKALAGAARGEVSLMAALCVLAGGLALFLDLAEETGENETHGFDMAVLTALRVPRQPGRPLGPHWLLTTATDVTALGSTTVLCLIGLAAIGFLLLRGRRASALMMLAAVGGGLALSNLTKLIFHRDRPDLAYRIVDATQYSFPSGHALISTATYLTLGALIARAIREPRAKLYVQFLAVLLAFLIGLSRIYLGVHWATDVLGGWGLGGAWAMALWLAAWAMERRARLASGPPDA